MQPAQRKYTPQETIQIYTDWANHYLEKGRSKRRVSHLASDCSDGVLLSDVIESVMSTKIQGVNRKPKSSIQMLENIGCCMAALRAQNVSGVEAICDTDLQEGRLKAVLALFFALSRHKQASKQQRSSAQAAAAAMAPQHTDAAPHRQVGKANVGSSIPLPGSALPSRQRCLPEKVRSAGAPSSRPSSPALSLIPRVGANNPATLNTFSQKTSIDKPKLISKSNNSSSQHMLPSNSGKCTSSSSGVSSSALSEKSDSSVSLEPSEKMRSMRYKNPKMSPKSGAPHLSSKGVATPAPKKIESAASTKSVQKLSNSKLTEPRVKVATMKAAGGVVASSPSAGLASATGIPKPTAAVKGTAKVIRDERRLSGLVPPQLKEPQLDGGLKVTAQAAAAVSQLQSEALSSQLSESSNSVSTGQHSNSSESSVIYRPSSESENEPPAAPRTGLVPGGNDGDPMGQHSYPSSGSTASAFAPARDAEDDVSITMTVKPMMPFANVRGYCNNLTLPARRQPTATAALQRKLLPPHGNDCSDLHFNGYMSDGEVLRTTNDTRGRDNILYDGYISEQDHRKITNGDMDTLLLHAFGGPGSLTVLTEQCRPQRGARGGAATVTSEDVPPPLGPRPGNTHSRHSRSTTSAENGPPQNAHWKKYTDSPGVGTPIQIQNDHGTPTSNKRDRKAFSHEQSKEKGSCKVRVPQSFGYVKRNSIDASGITATAISGPEGGVNQAGNSKTAHVSAVPRTKVKVSGGTQTCSSDLQQVHHKSPSQYKSYSLTGHAASQLSQSVRERLLLGSQSLPKGGSAAAGAITPLEYNLVMRHVRPKASDGSLSDTQATESASPYAPWLRHSNTYSMGARLADTDSLESLSNIHGHRSSLTHARLLRDSASSTTSSTARLSRSNSIRSTKSEKLYPSMLHRGVEIEPEPYYCLPVGTPHWSQPTSPAPGTTAGTHHIFPLSPTHASIQGRHAILPKNDEVHGSSVSLVSTTSSLYSSAEEKQAHEIRKLRRELMDAQDKVHTLTSQLTNNAHVVSAFEQSLSSMTQRLQHLTATAERKDSELAELRAAMDSLRAQSLQVGLSTGGLVRQPSSDSVSSMSSACSLDKNEKKKKKGWLRSSFTKAFSRNAKQTKVQTFSCGESNVSGGSSGEVCGDNKDKENTSGQSKRVPPEVVTDGEVEELQKQLREKDMVLTDIRLEALSSAHQLESLKDTVMKMRSEMLSLKQNNERLQRIVGGSMHSDSDNHMQAMNHEPPPDVIAIDDNVLETETDGKRISISVYLGQPQTFDRYYAENYGSDECPNTPEGQEITIAFKNIGSSISWGQLDVTVRRTFKQHVARLDPANSLGLGGDSIAKYRLGDAERSPEAQPPDLLPVGYVVGRISTLHIILQSVCALSFEALIPKGVAQRLVTLLAEHRRLVLCGPPGTGKTHLAQRLAHYHAQTQGKDPSEAIATFNVDHKSGKELHQYLAHLGEQASGGDRGVLPSVVVLDNLHRAGPLSEAIGALPRALPCLIGTMAQAACSTTSLQLQHGFRWVLVAPHLEPASGLLARVLNRRMATLELTQGERPELSAILTWLPRVWKHLNKFLETHSSGDVTIGPRLFLACPLDLDASKAWFSDVWNYSLAPYLREAAKEGLQLYGRRAPWVDPLQFIIDTYPWVGTLPQTLTRIEPHDVGLETNNMIQSECDTDPLLNMLMRLQEAANYSSPHSNDSDCASLDSNITHGSSIGTESVL